MRKSAVFGRRGGFGMRPRSQMVPLLRRHIVPLSPMPVSIALVSIVLASSPVFGGVSRLSPPVTAPAACTAMVSDLNGFAPTPGEAAAAAQTQDFSRVRIQAEKVRDGIFMLSGGGGNIGVLTGGEGVLIIDAMFAPLHEKILKAIGELEQGSKPVRWLIDTHNHYDHVDGNAAFGAEGVEIIAHRAVRELMSENWSHPMMPGEIPAYPEEGLPDLTFDDSLTLFFNGEEIRLQHVPDAHTRGDCVVFFKQANVFHLGDLLFAGGYPFIDVPHGGSIGGIIAALDKVLEMTDDNTRIIPGHGPLYSAGELRSYRAILSSVKTRVEELIRQGMSEDEVVAAKPTAEFDALYQAAFGADDFVRVVYADLSRKRPG